MTTWLQWPMHCWKSSFDANFPFIHLSDRLRNNSHSILGHWRANLAITV